MADWFCCKWFDVHLSANITCVTYIQYGFGENEAYDTSNFLEGKRKLRYQIKNGNGCGELVFPFYWFTFSGFRHWLQHNLKLGIPVFFGRYGLPFGLIPKRVPIHLEVSTELYWALLLYSVGIEGYMRLC